MTQRIYKYPLRVTDTQYVGLPIGAKILKVANQNEELCLWAIVDVHEPKIQPRAIRIFGTGHVMPPRTNALTFIDTVLMSGGSLVWHIFEQEN